MTRIVLVTLALSVTVGAQTPAQRTFASPDEAVQALAAATRAGDLDALRSLFGPESQELIASSDPATAQMNRKVFAAAFKERHSLADEGPDRKSLVIGNEDWPFPVPLVKDGNAWRFDTAAGKEEIIARRIGRNELAAIDTCRAYVAAQHRYAAAGHDGKPAGAFASQLKSDAGKQNGLYWPAKHGEKLSPLGDLVAKAQSEGRTLDPSGAPTPLNGYYFRMVAAQGKAMPVLVAWPAQYDASGVMTFVVQQDGIVREKDLGPGTDAAARNVKGGKPDASWHAVK